MIRGTSRRKRKKRERCGRDHDGNYDACVDGCFWDAVYYGIIEYTTGTAVSCGGSGRDRGFRASVIESCKEQAIKNGYSSLDVKKIQTIYGYPCALVELDYRYTIPVLDLLLDHHIKGYAR